MEGRQHPRSSTSAHRRQLDEGVRHHEAGRLEDALACYQEVLAHDPNDADALHLSGVVLASRGQYDEAIARIRQALGLRPHVAVFHSNLGNALFQQGRLAQAIESYREALRLRPDNVGMQRNLARACKKRYTQAVKDYGAARFSEAEGGCRQVLDAYPDRADAWHLSGLIASARGEVAAGIERFQRATYIAPGEAPYHANLGALLARQGQHARAEECYRRAIEIDPGLVDAYANLGLALRALGRLQPAIASFRKVLALNPNHVEAHFRLADLLRVAGRHDEAVAAARQAVKLGPDDARTHGQLGIVLRSVNRTTEAIEACRKSLELDPGAAGTHNNLAQLLKDQARSDEARASYRKAVEIDPANATVHSNLLFSLHYDEPYNAQLIFDEHRRWAERHGTPLSNRMPPLAITRDPEKRLRIGYVSGDLKTHSVAFFLEPLLAARDRIAFEVFCYANNSTADTTTARLRVLADAWRDISNLDDERAAGVIRADAIDILVDLSGHTKDNRLPMFTRKPAPIQVTYLGYPDTTGTNTIDYRLTDERADPPGRTEAFHTEKLVHLPDGFLCYQPPPSCPEAGPLPMLRDGRVTFASFNNLAKVSSTVIDYWGAILLAVPSSRLLLKSKALADTGTREVLLQRFRDHGVSAERIELAGWTKDQIDHMSLYREVDIGLDTYPYHGTTTTCEALWMGVPVVTLAGPVHVSRVGVSLLYAARLADLIAESPQAYVRLAVELANDANRLTALRSALRERMQTAPLADAKRITASIETAFRSMWRDFCSNAVPASGVGC